jgi:hypothetical protein
MNMKSCSSFSKVNIKLKLNIIIFKLKSRIFETYVQVEVEHHRDEVQVSPSRYERGIIEEPPPNKRSYV